MRRKGSTFTSIGRALCVSPLRASQLTWLAARNEKRNLHAATHSIAVFLKLMRS